MTTRQQRQSRRNLERSLNRMGGRGDPTVAEGCAFGGCALGAMLLNLLWISLVAFVVFMIAKEVFGW